MSLLPAYVEDEEDLLEETEQVETPREFAIDFTTGQLTGEVVEGIEAVKVWVYLALRIARYRYFILSWEYGSELDDLSGQGYSQEHIECEVEEMIKDCLMENEYIDSVEVSNIQLENEKMKANITITTVLDETFEQEYEEVA